MRNIQMSQELINRLGCKQIIDVTDKLPVNPSYTWEQLAGRRDINNLTTIGLHHDDYPKNNTVNHDDMTFMKNIAIDHIKLKKNEPKGDAGFPYHFWIRNGQSYQTNNVLDRTYGIGNNNGYVIHICISGDYTQDTLIVEDRNALLGIMYTLTTILPSYKEVKAHSELNKTECPAYDYTGIKSDLQTLQNQMSQQNTWEAKLTKIAQMINQFNYFNSLVKNGKEDGNAVWAVAQQMELYEVMKTKGYV